MVFNTAGYPIIVAITVKLLCFHRDAVCGLLQCSGGGDSPIISNVKHSEITTRLSEDTITCK